MTPELKKYLFFVVVVVLCIGSDQSTKLWSEARLSSPNPPIGPAHTFKVEVPTASKGQSLQDFLAEDLEGTPPKQLSRIARGGVLVNGERKFNPSLELQGGETLEITARRNIVVVENFFDFRYTRNPGAAFGFLSQSDASWRRAFFLGVSVLAVLMILFIFRKVTWDQKLLVWSLSLIVGGALGNFIDRVAYGWVIDFIDWHYYDTRWPTFNIADAQISIGVALMALEILFGKGTIDGSDPEGQAKLDASESTSESV